MAYRFERLAIMIYISGAVWAMCGAIFVFSHSPRDYLVPVFFAAFLSVVIGALWFTIPIPASRDNQPTEKVKMYLIFAKESLDLMKGIRGKMMTQAGHGYLHAFWDSMDRFPALARAYRTTSHAYKITLVVPTVAELKVLEASYRDICGVSLVTDAGFTVFAEPTTTCLGIGPIPESQIGDDLRALKTLT